MALRDVRIDEALVTSASELQEAEREALFAELLDEGECAFAEGADVLHVTRDTTGYQLSLRDAEGATRALGTVAHAEIAKTFDEYVDIVRKLGDTGSDGGYDRVDALDMAKRVTHDQGGRIVLRGCRALGVDLPTARRLFTLLLSLEVDTTSLGARTHHGL